MTAISDDRFLGGAVQVRQPGRGFRSGLDAVILSAAVPAMARDSVLELGAGAGVASLCLATRVAGCAITGVEIDAELVRLANESAKLNGLEARVSFRQGNVLATSGRGEFNHVFTNPPFNDAHARSSPLANRARAKQMDDHFGAWIRSGLKRLRSRGTLTLIVRTERLIDILAHSSQTGLVIYPLWPRAGQPAKRIIVQMLKGSSAPPILSAGLVLHASDGKYTHEADAVLRGRANLILT